MSDRSDELARELVEADEYLRQALENDEPWSVEHWSRHREMLADRRYLVLRRDIAAGRFDRTKPRKVLAGV